MPQPRLRSKKLRALQQALGMPPREIAARHSVLPLSYRELARHWEEVVNRHPGIPRKFRFSSSDVYRLFKRYGGREG